MLLSDDVLRLRDDGPGLLAHCRALTADITVRPAELNYTVLLPPGSDGLPTRAECSDAYFYAGVPANGVTLHFDEKFAFRKQVEKILEKAIADEVGGRAGGRVGGWVSVTGRADLRFRVHRAYPLRRHIHTHSCWPA